MILKGSDYNILKVFQIVGSVKKNLQNFGSNTEKKFASVYVSMTGMRRLAGLESLAVPHKWRRQRHPNNVAASAHDE